MSCNRFSDLPAAASSLLANDIIPITQLGVDRRTNPEAIATSVSRWSSTAPYRIGALVAGSDLNTNNIYRAVSTNTGQDPASKNPAIWLPVLFTANATLLVPSEFTTIQLALEYIAEAFIPEDVTVTIQVAAGVYNLTTSQINLNHPCGSRIRLIGISFPTLSFTVLPDPPSTVLLQNSGSIFINNGNSFGLIDGFVITKTGGAPAFGHCALLAYNGTINYGLLVISGFWAQVASAAGGLANAVDAGANLDTSFANTYALYTDAGRIQAPSQAISTVASSTLARIDHGGEIVLTGTNATGTNAATSSIYQISQGGKIDDTGVTYGSFASFASVNGLLEFNDYTTCDEFGTYPTRNSLLAIFQSPTVRAGTSLVIGDTSSFNGLQSGQAILDASGAVVVAAPWVTTNSIPVVSGNDVTTGHIFADIAEIVNFTSFTIRSTAGATDVGLAVNWIVVVYP
jgi:hypothetical protein